MLICKYVVLSKGVIMFLLQSRTKRNGVWIDWIIIEQFFHYEDIILAKEELDEEQKVNIENNDVETRIKEEDE